MLVPIVVDALAVLIPIGFDAIVVYALAVLVHTWFDALTLLVPISFHALRKMQQTK